MMRYIKRLSDKDYALDRGMIPLGSCTMKLNAATEMEAVSWPEFNSLHPFAPTEDTQGYLIMMSHLETWLSELTGYDSISLQPNAGSQGEYAGLLAIRGYHLSRGDAHRTICLIPSSAHGTNAASAVLAGMQVVVVACKDNGDVDIDDVMAKIAEHGDTLAALMVTYPSTHGVYEHGIKDVTDAVHQAGGQVYIDGANLNALGRVCPLWRHRGRRLPPESPQDLLHSPRRWGTRCGSGRRESPPGTLLARTPARPDDPAPTL
jgi:glycine dehydrogenase